MLRLPDSADSEKPSELDAIKTRVAATNTSLEKNIDWMTRHLNLQNDRIAVNKEAIESQVHNLEATFNKELVDQFSKLQNRFMFGVSTLPLSLIIIPTN